MRLLVLLCLLFILACEHVDNDTMKKREEEFNLLKIEKLQIKAKKDVVNQE